MPRFSTTPRRNFEFVEAQLLPRYGSPIETAGALSGFLLCAQCGSRITYDPKVKASGKRYDYYRCANGHRVHTKRIHVTEAQLLAQFEAAIANIEMPEALANEISRVLRETHEVVRAERRREIAVLKRTIEDVQTREDKIVAMYVDGKLDDVTYQRQRDLLMIEKYAAMDRLSAANDELDDKYRVTADRCFELAKCARTLWNQRSPAERRLLLEIVVSNPRLDGVEVRYEMKNCSPSLPRWRTVPIGAPGMIRIPPVACAFTVRQRRGGATEASGVAVFATRTSPPRRRDEGVRRCHDQKGACSVRPRRWVCCIVSSRVEWIGMSFAKP